MRYGSEHKAQTRSRVVQEAAAAIRSDGVERIGVAQIMARAGLTHGGFYAHFDSKDDLIAQAVEFMFEDRYSAFFSHLDDPDPRAALKRFVDYYLSMRHRNAPDRGCPIPGLAGQVAHLPEKARDRFQLAVDRLTGGVATLLERAGEPDAGDTSLSVVSEMVGAISVARTLSDEGKAERLLSTTRTSVCMKLGLSGYDERA